MEGFGDQGFVLSEVESLRVQSFVASLKSFTLKGGATSTVGCSTHVAMILYLGILNV